MKISTTQQIALWILIIGILSVFTIHEINRNKELNNQIAELKQEKIELNQETPKEEVEIKTGCFLIDNLGERDVCLKNEPYVKWDCTKFTDYAFVISCYQTLAKYYKDAQYCIKLKADYDRDNCYLAVANEVNNPELCMGIMFPDIRISCYRKINLKGFSPDICTSGWTLDARHECRELIMEANE